MTKYTASHPRKFSLVCFVILGDGEERGRGQGGEDEYFCSTFAEFLVEANEFLLILFLGDFEHGNSDDF